jgi:hypothetical protein
VLSEIMRLTLKSVGILFGGCGIFMLYMAWLADGFLLQGCVYLALAAIITWFTDRRRGVGNG